jgi:hypothetical protein
MSNTSKWKENVMSWLFCNLCVPFFNIIWHVKIHVKMLMILKTWLHSQCMRWIFHVYFVMFNLTIMSFQISYINLETHVLFNLLIMNLMSLYGQVWLISRSLESKCKGHKNHVFVILCRSIKKIGVLFDPYAPWNPCWCIQIGWGLIICISGWFCINKLTFS